MCWCRFCDRWLLCASLSLSLPLFPLSHTLLVAGFILLDSCTPTGGWMSRSNPRTATWPLPARTKQSMYSRVCQSFAVPATPCSASCCAVFCGVWFGCACSLLRLCTELQGYWKLLRWHHASTSHVCLARNQWKRCTTCFSAVSLLLSLILTHSFHPAGNPQKKGNQ